MDCKFKVVKLHHYPDFTEETAQLLNSEWPRSLEARCHVVRESSDDLPCCFVLLKVSADCTLETVAGFGRLSKVLQKPKSVLIESVIVEKSLRGCGLGKMIMTYIEEFALRHGYETVHLSTHDKQSFYEHLGYTLSTPVSAETKVSRLFHNSQVDNANNSAKQGEDIKSVIKSANNLEIEKSIKPCQLVETSPVLIQPLPAAPPPPLPPPPAAPPPPPAAPPMITGRQVSSSVSNNAGRGNKGCVWLKKQLYNPNTPL